MPDTTKQLKWTEKGQRFILDMMSVETTAVALLPGIAFLSRRALHIFLTTKRK